MKTKMKMTKTNGKYTYEDLVLRKHALKHEIRELEEIITLENVPKALAFATHTLKEKTGSSSDILKFALETGAGLLINKLIFKGVSKSPVTNSIISFTTSYAVPFLVNKAKDIFFTKQ